MKPTLSTGRRLVFRGGVAAGLGLAFGLPGARAQGAWPTKPIRLVVGYAPGGGIDLLARALAPALGTSLGQQVLVENKPGAVGNIATADVVRSPADGYSALITTTVQQSVNPLVIKGSPNMAHDLVPVCIVGRFTYALVVRTDFPARTVADLLSLARAQPGKLTFASLGPGSLPHLIGELMQQEAGISMVHVPYKGAAPLMQALLSGEVDIGFTASASQFIDSGRLRVLAVASETRSSRYPDTPTLAESGIRGFDGSSWIGAWVPAGTPPDVVGRLENGLAAAVRQPDAKKRVEDIGAEPMVLNAARFRELLAREERVMAQVIRSRNIAVE